MRQHTEEDAVMLDLSKDHLDFTVHVSDESLENPDEF